MLHSKYIFETKRTKFKRRLKIFLLSVLGFVIIYGISCLIFISVARKESKKTREAFFKKTPDLIVIFTGDSGRIPYGIKLAKEYDQPNIFITGVYAKNSVNTLLRPLEKKYLQDPNLLEIDYSARNTVENIISTLHYLRKSNGQEEVLIVSHDYHILRIKLITDRLKAESDSFKFFYLGLESKYDNLRNIKILAKEVFKLIRAYGFLFLWDPEVDFPPPVVSLLKERGG